MKKILVIAFSCLPKRGSEPGVGWNWSITAAKAGYDVTTLTRTKCRTKIETEIPEDLANNLHFIYCDSSSKLRKLSIYLEYIDWQRRIKKFMKKLLYSECFDRIWFLTWGNLFLPVGICKTDIPIIWGPIGGGEAVPKLFWKKWKIKDKIPQIIRALLIKTIPINYMILKMARRSWKIIARTEETKSVFPLKYQKKISIKLETCFDVNEILGEKREKREEKENINILYTGRLIPLKNVEMLIRAFSECCKKTKKALFLSVVGDGTQKNVLKELAQRLEVSNISFEGNIDHTEVLHKLETCDIFAFSSLKEGASWSILEAMSMGKPIVCLNLSGIKATTSDECAYRVNIEDGNTIGDIQKKYSLALLNMINLSDEKRRSIGMKGIQRIRDEFSVESNIDIVKQWME